MCFSSGLWAKPEAPDERNIVFRRLRDRGLEFMLSTHPGSKNIDLCKFEGLVDLFSGLLAIDPNSRFCSVD